MGSATARIGLVGDVHQEDRALEEALGRFAREGVDLVACVGDIADGPGDLERCCALLAQAHAEVVRGNHDRWLLAGTARDLPDAHPPLGEGEARRFLASLPVTREFPTALGPMLLCHGLGRSDMSMVTPDDFGYALETNDELQLLLRARAYRLVVAGHSHVPMVRRFAQAEMTMINPGTLLRSRNPGYAIADLVEGAVQFYCFDSEGKSREKGRFPLQGREAPPGGD